MKLALPLILVALTAVLVSSASPAYAQVKLTEADPPDGAKLDRPPEFVRLCFSQTVIIEDSTNFNFRYVLPDGRSLGLRIVFQPDGECVDVFPGMPDDYPAGKHTFRWQVTAAEGGEEGSGKLEFQITEGGTPEPSLSPTASATRVAATPEAGTPPAVTPEAGTPTIETTPEGTAEAEASPVLTPSPEGGGPDAADDGGDDGPDILLAALITTGVAGGAAVLFTLGYLLRRRIGYEPHRPPEDGEGDEGH